MTALRIVNVNLQEGFGGGEIYTRFFLRALSANGLTSRLIVHPAAKAWDSLPSSIESIAVDSFASIPRILARDSPTWLIFHTPAGAEITSALQAQGHFVSCFAHMPLYGRNPQSLAAYDAIFPVSGHVRDSALAAGLTQVYHEPMYGIADFHARAGDGDGSIVARSPYDWDRRKFRDRAMGMLEPLLEPFLLRKPYVKGSGIVLGIVSRLTTIKQFPQLFLLLAPVLARHPEFRVEIFGAGGYASVRDLRKALAPIGQRVGFWGHQKEMLKVYSGIDYLLTGLPEKEALGLNVIEAQACGIPVLAVGAPPFTETIAAEVSGLFYRDPRQDAGADFECLLDRLQAQPLRIDGIRVAEHFERFSEKAFVDRVSKLIVWTAERLVEKCPR